MKPGKIRPIAICVFRNDGKLLVGEHYDTVKEKTFYRPLGGAIEFGELGRECAAREIREEMGAEVRDVAYLDTIENVFTYDGKPGHEIVLVYEGKLVDSHLYKVESVRCKNDGEEFIAVWKPIRAFRDGGALLYPEGLLEILDSKTE
jgi:8-oxo-dGTP pyrophosphatase MutT (NUDIX family)